MGRINTATYERLERLARDLADNGHMAAIDIDADTRYARLAGHDDLADRLRTVDAGRPGMLTADQARLADRLHAARLRDLRRLVTMGWARGSWVGYATTYAGGARRDRVYEATEWTRSTFATEETTT